MTAITRHCALCTCADDLCDHCEGHFEMARAVGRSQPCGPCPATGRIDPEHHLEDDFDGTRWCPGCGTQED